MRKLLLFVLLCLPAAAMAQGVQRIAQATTNSNGFVKVVSGAQISVCIYSGGACTGTATLFSDPNLSVPLSNPFFADGNGNYTYYVSAGNYLETVSSPGTVPALIQVTLNSGSGGNSFSGGVNQLMTKTSATTNSTVNGVANGDLVLYNGTGWVRFGGNISGTQCLQENNTGGAAWGPCGGNSFGGTNNQIMLQSTSSTNTTLNGSGQGDLAYYTGTTWARFAANISGLNCLQENGVGLPSWGPCGSGGGNAFGGSNNQLMTQVNTSTSSSVNGSANGDLPMYNGTSWADFASNSGGSAAACLQESTSGAASWVTCITSLGGTNNQLVTQSSSTTTATVNGSVNGDLVVYNGTNWVKFAANGTGTQCLQENSSGAPSWGSCVNSFGGTNAQLMLQSSSSATTTVNGAANGDLALYNGTTWVDFASNNGGAQTNCLQETTSGAASWALCNFGGTVTNTLGALTSGAMMAGNGSNDSTVDPNITTDFQGDLTLAAGASGTGSLAAAGTVTANSAAFGASPPSVTCSSCFAQGEVGTNGTGAIGVDTMQAFSGTNTVAQLNHTFYCNYNGAGSGGTWTPCFAPYVAGAAEGDIVYWDTTNGWKKLTGNASGTAFLSETSGGVPSWAAGTSNPPLFPINPQTATYTTTTTDWSNCKEISIASGTFTLSLLATPPANGQCVFVSNYGTGVITISGNGNNINGSASSQTLAAASASAPTGAFIVSNGTVYFYQSMGGSGGGGSAFSALTGGTNTAAAMLCGTGCSLGPTGSGTVNANQVNGSSVPTSAIVLGSTSGGALQAANLNSNTVWFGNGSNVTVAGALPLTAVATQAANTVVANVTGSTAAPTAATLPSCSTSSSALTYTSGTGFGCNTIAGSGTVNTGQNGQVGGYLTTGNTISGLPNLTFNTSSAGYITMGQSGSVAGGLSIVSANTSSATTVTSLTGCTSLAFTRGGSGTSTVVEVGCSATFAGLANQYIWFTSGTINNSNQGPYLVTAVSTTTTTNDTVTVYDPAPTMVTQTVTVAPVSAYSAFQQKTQYADMNAGQETMSDVNLKLTGYGFAGTVLNIIHQNDLAVAGQSQEQLVNVNANYNTQGNGTGGLFGITDSITVTGGSNTTAAAINSNCFFNENSTGTSSKNVCFNANPFIQITGGHTLSLAASYLATMNVNSASGGTTGTNNVTSSYLVDLSGWNLTALTGGGTVNFTGNAAMMLVGGPPASAPTGIVFTSSKLAGIVVDPNGTYPANAVTAVSAYGIDVGGTPGSGSGDIYLAAPTATNTGWLSLGSHAKIQYLGAWDQTAADDCLLCMNTTDLNANTSNNYGIEQHVTGNWSTGSAPPIIYLQSNVFKQQNVAAFTFPSVIDYEAGVSSAAATIFTSWKGFATKDATATGFLNPGTYTNAYGFYAGIMKGSGTYTNIPYSFYASDTAAANYFKGSFFSTDMALSCTLSSGACSASLSHTYTAAPTCQLTVTSTGTFTGVLRLGTVTTSTVNVTDTALGDNAVINIACVGY